MHSTRSVHDCPLCRALLELATSAAENRAEAERRRATIAVVNRQGSAA